MTTFVVREGTRWARAVVLPAAILALVAAMRGAAKSIDASLPPTHAAAVWQGPVVVAAVWLAAAIVRTALQPGRDRRAAEHLQDMRVRTALPDHALLCILNTAWTSPAGQRVAAVDVRTGAVCEVWLAESGMAAGTYVLVSLRQGAAVALDSATPPMVLDAQRHEQRIDLRKRGTRRSGAQARLEHRRAAGVVRGAEALLRGR
ncbi:hypothetical protein OEB99_03045 [Actinotalea sp. M2MS4P-6]|uniref:hypothetical protein n=1 Tax=Actinotalea sp. M2MS4P-6 TaxID=2983762 RepID=UPI0021E3629F|nr:hypothetical protein [Actinotalea sp. M2MS4P-6]MCV2393275.1 hypothetical protein [Actinotalea sp. M2MS4P-6]